MVGVNFDENTILNKTITTDELYLVIKALKLKEFADSQNNEAINVADRHVETNLIKRFEEIHEHASLLKERRIHIIVAEPIRF